MRTLAIILALTALCGCGRSNTIYPADANGIVSTDEIVLPSGFYDQSVNNASVDISGDFSSDSGRFLRFRILGGDSAAGAFNDASATGSRAILGIGKYDKTLLSDFSLQMKSVGGNLTTSLLVDLACDGTTPVQTLVSKELTPGDNTLTTSSTDWAASTEIKDASGNVLVPSLASGSHVSLDDLLAAYPSACLKNSNSDALDLPSMKTPMGAVLLTLGDRSSKAVDEADVPSLKINGTEYTKWGRP